MELGASNGRREGKSLPVSRLKLRRGGIALARLVRRGQWGVTNRREAEGAEGETVGGEEVVRFDERLKKGKLKAGVVEIVLLLVATAKAQRQSYPWVRTVPLGSAGFEREGWSFVLTSSRTLRVIFQWNFSFP